jgi:hypothetical protein
LAAMSLRLLLILLGLGSLGANAAAPDRPLPSAWPQAYSVRQEKSSGRLTLTNEYYRVEHDLNRGGAVSRIQLRYGRAENLLVEPLETLVRDEAGAVYSNLNDASPRVRHSREGLTEIVTVESALVDAKGAVAKGVQLKTRLEYHWGYIKVHQEFVTRRGGARVTELCVANMILAPSLSSYGYREGITEESGAPHFSFGSCRWGRIDAGNPSLAVVQTNQLPRYLLFADAGSEGLEWFEGSDLGQWDLQLTGRRGEGKFCVERGPSPGGAKVTLSPFQRSQPLWLTNSCSFDYYLGIPIREEYALRPWFHTSFNRNRGEWVSTSQIQRWAESGIQTVHCHNDGDYYDDGLFWRDGSYPPYPDMDHYDKVIADCHAAGIRVATYFSNKELHPSTPEFQKQGDEWARKDLRGNLAHNFFRGTNEFGAQMCLRSGWLPFLESSIDRVLTHHRLDGVYYDWNVALLCYNERHRPGGAAPAAAAHWDIDELLTLMEWTRQRVGPNGLIIVHNTTTPMFATENFANYVVANEWGYGKWTGKGPKLQDLPLEWSLVGARPRGVISYGQLDAQSPDRLKRLFALEALLSGVTPWPVSREAEELFSVLKPIHELETCRFVDWRNEAVALKGGHCASAVYSRPGEAYLVLANLEENNEEPHCVVRTGNLPCPIPNLRTATLIRTGAAQASGSAPSESALDAKALTTDGVRIPIPGDTAVLVRLQ